MQGRLHTLNAGQTKENRCRHYLDSLDVHEEDYVWLFNVGDGRVILKRISSVL